MIPNINGLQVYTTQELLLELMRRLDTRRKVTQIRVDDKIILTDGVSPLRFFFIGDVTKSLYQFDAKGNMLCVGRWNAEE